MKRKTQSVADALHQQAKTNFLPEQIRELIFRARKATDDRILRLPQVREKVGRASATIWKDVSEGTFPPPVRIGPRAVGWKNSELQAWLEACSISSRSKQRLDMKAFVAALIASTGDVHAQP